MLDGDEMVPNMEGDRTNARIYTFELSHGIWRGLSVRTQLPLLDVIAESDETGRERSFALGDMPLTFFYLFRGDQIPSRWNLSPGLGAYLPTGSTVETDIPSNSSFASGTVDPIASLSAGLDPLPVFGLYVHGFARIVVAENSDGFRAGSAFLYGAGGRLRYLESLVLALGINVLHRLKNEQDGEPDDMTGGVAVYLAPSLSYLVLTGPAAGLSFRLGLQAPLYQRMNGMQLAEDFTFSVGIGYGFQIYGD